MPLEILLPFVVIGLAIVAGLMHALGLSRRLVLRDTAQAMAAWQNEFPGDPPRSATLSQDGRAALIDTAQGRGIVWVMGLDTTARSLEGARLMQTRRGMRIELPDYAAPHISLTLTEAEAAQWPRLIEGENDRYAHLS